jgi:hypothetical protein
MSNRPVGGRTAASARNQQIAQEFAERMRPVMSELAELSSHKVAAELNRRGIKSARGGEWHVATVQRLRLRLAARPSR